MEANQISIPDLDDEEIFKNLPKPPFAPAGSAAPASTSGSDFGRGPSLEDLPGPSRPWLTHGRSISGTSGDSSGPGGEGSGGETGSLANGKSSSGPWAFPRKGSFASLKAAIKGGGGGGNVVPSSSSQLAESSSARQGFGRTTNGTNPAASTTQRKGTSGPHSHGRSQSQISGGQSRSLTQILPPPINPTFSYASHRGHGQQASYYSEQSAGTGTGSSGVGYVGQPPLPPFPEQFYSGNNAGPNYQQPMRPSESESALPPPRNSSDYLHDEFVPPHPPSASYFDQLGKYQSDGNLAGYGWMNEPSQAGSSQPMPITTAATPSSVRLLSGGPSKLGTLPHGIGSPDPRTPSEYAINVLMSRYLTRTRVKVQAVLDHGMEAEPLLEQSFGPRADEEFEALLASIAHVSRSNTKLIVESLFNWHTMHLDSLVDAETVRRAMSEAAHLNASQQSMAAAASTTGSGSTGSLGNPAGGGVSDVATILSRRKSLVCTYLLSRSLIEVSKQMQAGSLGEGTLSNFLSNLFELLQDCSRNRLPKSIMQSTTFEEVSRLLGELSKKYFTPIGDRFISMLEHCAKLPPSKNVELSQETAVQGMRHLSITVFPMETFEEAAEFLETIARFFSEAHGQRVKVAYAETLTHLILPVAKSASAEINHPTWHRAVEIIAPRAYTMAMKPRYWPVAYPLYVATLCGSSDESFMNGFGGNWGWTSCLESAMPRLKDRSLRPIVLNTALKLIWVYMFRCRESNATTTKRLGVFFRQWFPPMRPGIINGAESSTAPHIAMLQLALYKHFEFGRDLTLDFLRHSALSGTVLSLQTEILSPPRMIAAIRAVILVLDAHVKGESPAFPSTPDFSRYETITLNGMGDELPETFSFPKPEIAEAQGKFDDLIGKIALICDHQVGGMSVFDDSTIVLRGAGYGLSSSSAGSTAPISQSTALAASYLDHERYLLRQHPRSRLTLAYLRDQQPYLDLLRACFESWPRCLASSIPYASVLSVLFRATLSADPDLGETASQTLRRIARQRSNGAASVVSGFGRFIFRTSGVIWETHPHQLPLLVKVEAAVKVWIDFLNIWLNRLRASMEQQEQGVDAKMERTSAWAINDDVEAYGLLLLCSGHRQLRRLAISTLRIVSIIDEAFATPKGDRHTGRDSTVTDGFSAGSEPTRIIHLLDLPCRTFCNVEDSRMSADQRQKVTEWNRSHSMHPLSDLAESENPIEHSLWQHVLPTFLRNCLERFPTTVAVFRSHVTKRMLSMDAAVVVAAGLVPRTTTTHGTTKSIPSSTAVLPGQNSAPQGTSSPADQALMAEHWKMYILALCTTTTSTEGSRGAVNPATQWRQQSGDGDSSERVIAARDLFQKLVPFLAADQAKFRDAVVMALGNINRNLYRTLLETLQSVSSQLSDGGHNRPSGRATAPARRHTRLRTALAHVLQLTSSHMSVDSVLSDSAIMNLVISWVKDTFNFLIAKEVETDWDLQLLRQYFCGVVEDLYHGLADRGECDRFFPFGSRLRMFKMFADWYAYSQSAKDGPSRLANLLASVAEQTRDDKQREIALTTLRSETQALSFHASDAMATLCSGPITDPSTPTTKTPFAATWLVSWLQGLFKSPSPINHAVARRALHSLLEKNPGNSNLINVLLVGAFHEPDKTRAPHSLFASLCDTIVAVGNVEVPLHHVYCLGLTRLGHPDADLRRKAFALLDWAARKSSPELSLHDIEVGVNSPLPATYLRAQREGSAYLAHHFSSLKVAMVCEYTLRLDDIDASRRSTTLGLLPDWLRNIDLLQGADHAGGYNSLTYCSMLVLSNLLFLTIKYGDEHNFEIQDAWSSLAEGAQILLNANAIIKFLIEQGLCNPTPSFVVQAKRVVSCLSHTIIGPLMFDELCAFIEPTTMIPVPRDEVAVQPSTAIHSHLYRADLSSLLPEPSSRHVFSPGQLALLFIGELTYERSDRLSNKLPCLLHAIFVQLDSIIPFLQEQTIAMFEQLMRSMVAMSSSVVGKERAATAKAQVDRLCSKGASDFWSHTDLDITLDEMKTPRAMRALLSETLNILQPLAPNLAEQWGDIALFWATSGPVRHIACRSFQAFRILLPFATPTMVADMLGRLSNTISDPNPGIQSFSLEILYTLTALVRWTDGGEGRQHLFSQTFWAAIASLNTINEREYAVAVDMLDGLLDKLDLGDPEIINLLLSKLPEGWEGERGSIQPLVLRGLRSSVTSVTSFKVLTRLAKVQDVTLIESSPDDRLAFLFVNALPWFLQSTNSTPQARDVSVLALAEDIATLSELQGKTDLARVASSIAKSRFRTKDDLVRQAINCVRTNFLPRLGPRLAVSLLGLTLNQHDWLRNQTMQVLKIYFQVVDTNCPEFARLGSELLMPLLRLLSTPLAAQALEVLDEPITIRGGPAANQILRMSLQWGKPSRWREQGNDASIFGAPDESGWAVANPQELTSRTRINIQAVFKMCEMTLDVAPVSMVDFVNEDYGLMEDGHDYLATRDAPGALSIGTEGNVVSSDAVESGTLGDLVNQLQDLTSFFADDNGSGSGSSSVGGTVVNGGISSLVAPSSAHQRHRLPYHHNARVLGGVVLPFGIGLGGRDNYPVLQEEEENDGEGNEGENDGAVEDSDEEEEEETGNQEDLTLEAARVTPLPGTGEDTLSSPPLQQEGAGVKSGTTSERTGSGKKTHRAKQSSSGEEAFDPDLVLGATRPPITDDSVVWTKGGGGVGGAGGLGSGRTGPWREIPPPGSRRRSFFYRKPSGDAGSGGSVGAGAQSPV